MLANNWKQNLHLEPEKGWLNDPNGLAYFKGKYHIFHQYSYEVNGGLKLWYYYTSKDLIKYEDRGVFLTPTIEEEKNGVYSGSANIEGDKLVFYYTGNVKYKGDYDYVHAGRGHNTISFETEDGINFTEKKCLLKTDDYPNMSNHVRDPKIFEKNGKKYLVLGARDSNDCGCLLVYYKDTLKPYKTIYSQKNLGFMWECPDYFQLKDEKTGKVVDILAACPQGLEPQGDLYNNKYQSGYFFGKLNYEKPEFEIYGINFEHDNLPNNVHYKGAFSPEELPNHLQGGFGLVWDGDSSDTCSGMYGEYLKINNPHKASLYLASNFPIIVWRQSALADFVIRNNCGIIIDSLYEITGILESMNEEKYQQLIDNCKKIGEKIRQGNYIKKALEECERKL